MSYVFISHAEEDRETTLELCRLLEANFIQTWVSFRDIAVGSNWGKEIETALCTADAVIVLATSSAVCSDWVRAEVEGALSEQMTVVPILSGEVKVPIRWKSLQSLNWDTDSPERIVSEINKVLPLTAMDTLKGYLSDREREDDLKLFILNHTEWLPIELNMHWHYRYAKDIKISKDNIIDCLAARMDSSGPRIFLYYLASPYEEPFDGNGCPSPRLSVLFDQIQSDVCWFTHDMQKINLLEPNVFLSHVAKQWKGSFLSRYTDVRVTVISGRREHYNYGNLNSLRQDYARSIEYNMASSLYRLRVDIVSYDRILESVASRSYDRAGWLQRYKRNSAKEESSADM